MTIEIINYPTRDLMKQGKILKHSQRFRPLHTDFVNNDESQGYRVTFVDGTDDPDNYQGKWGKLKKLFRL